MCAVELAITDELSPDLNSGGVTRVDVLPTDWAFAERQSHPQLGDMFVTASYWFYCEQPITPWIQAIVDKILVDPIIETAAWSGDAVVNPPEFSGGWMFQKQFLPGVTDNLAVTVQQSIALLFQGEALPPIRVASGKSYWLKQSDKTPDELIKAATYSVYNPLIESFTVFRVGQNDLKQFVFPLVQSAGQPDPVVVSLDLDDSGLIALSQAGTLALTLEEMKVIQAYYRRPDVQASRQQKNLPQWPTDIELEVIAQTWSEHCKHKIFAAKIAYSDYTDPDNPAFSEVDGLFKTFIAGSTKQLMASRPDLLSVFKDNSGVVRWDDRNAVCFKVETHNSPSALEPYGGALTGIVGVNRDILGTGLGAKPLFNTDVFCFAHPDMPHATRNKMLPPEAILLGVRKGVEDGGNKSGIPTVNGGLFFDPRYRAKPLVFCGTGGILPIELHDKLGYEKYTQPGDTLVMVGGRVGKDGIHGATFSSEALHEGSPVSAVQIGDPLTQKRLTDFLLAAQAQNLLTGNTDNGAGGLSSSVGEMAELTNGARIDIEKVPLKYPGLSPFEVIISESQERMSFSTNQYDALKALADAYDVELSAIGAFHDEGTFDIYRDGKLLASLELDFLHHGLPQMQLEAVWEPQRMAPISGPAPDDVSGLLLDMLAHPNICSREALIRQYDHEVQGRSVIKPLMGPQQNAPCDAAVLKPVLGDKAGLVVSNGLCPQYADWDAYAMAACAIDEAVRNAVAVGVDPNSLVLLDNFCWPDPLPSDRNHDADYKLAQLVRANQAIYDLALAYNAPFISGKDSMKNDFDDGQFRLSIPPTLLISAMGKIPDSDRAVSMEFKRPGDVIYLLGETHTHLGGSMYHQKMGWYSAYCPKVQPTQAKKSYEALFACISKGWIASSHDLSEAGLSVAVAESVLGGSLGAEISLAPIIEGSPELRWDEALFSETPSRILISVSPQHVVLVEAAFEGLPLFQLGVVMEAPQLQILDEHDTTRVSVNASDLLTAWRRAPAQCWEGAML